MKIMLHPHFIKFEEPKNELYLTFSAEVCSKNKEKILKFQKKIEGIIKKKKKFNNIEPEKKKKGLINRISKLNKKKDKDKDKDKNKDKFIYIYPKETLHFSIANFATYDIVNLQNFPKAKKVIVKTDNFKGLKDEIKTFETHFQKEVMSDDEFINVEARRLYLPGGIEGSLALNVFPTKKGFFDKLEEIAQKTKENLDKRCLSHDFKVKAYPEDDFQYFALNIFRFIGKDNFPIGPSASFYQEIKKINDNIQENSFILKMKPHIIVSYPYFADGKSLNC